MDANTLERILQATETHPLGAIILGVIMIAVVIAIGFLVAWILKNLPAISAGQRKEKAKDKESTETIIQIRPPELELRGESPRTSDPVEEWRR